MALKSRYTQRAFPEYRFIPGRTPHPTRDPRGHSYGRAPEKLDGFDADAWQDCEPYLYGIDLFNHGYWWEAHEAWEGRWNAAGKSTETGRFLQGLIQLAAACLKKHQGLEDGARMLAGEGMEKFPRTARDMLGIDLQHFGSAVNQFISGREAEAPTITLSGL